MLGANALTTTIASSDWQKAYSLLDAQNSSDSQSKSTIHNLLRKRTPSPCFLGDIRTSEILPIHQACAVSDVPLDFLRSLITAYPNSILKTETALSRTPLMIAIKGRTSEEVVLHLLHANSRAVSEQDRLGRLPIHYACSNHALPIVRKLMETCPETVAAADNMGWTPLHVAANTSSGPTEVVSTLLKLGGKHAARALTMTTLKGCTPLQCAKNIKIDGENKDAIVALLTAEESKLYNSMPMFKNIEEANDNDTHSASTKTSSGSSKRTWGIRKQKGEKSIRMLV